MAVAVFRCLLHMLSNFRGSHFQEHGSENVDPLPPTQPMSFLTSSSALLLFPNCQEWGAGGSSQGRDIGEND